MIAVCRDGRTNLQLTASPTNLRYYAYLFCIEKENKAAEGKSALSSECCPICVLKSATDVPSGELIALRDRQQDFLETMAASVNKYLDQNARRWVDLSSLFSFVKIA